MCLFLLVISVGCSKLESRPQPQQPLQQVQLKADGTYLSATLPCKCGDFTVYVPKSCPCFDKEQYPDLAAALEGVYAWMLAHNTGSGKKMIGKYEALTLECGCILYVYIPTSSGCLEAKSPDLAVLLRTVYEIAKKHQNKES